VESSDATGTSNRNARFFCSLIIRQVELVDFGATRTYSKEFMDNWFSLLQAAASGDRQACIDWSLKLGYITGGENEASVNFTTHYPFH